jgi:hypothetical protein
MRDGESLEVNGSVTRLQRITDHQEKNQLPDKLNSFFSPISCYPIGSYSLVPSLQLLYGLERQRSRAMRPPEHDPCFLSQCLLNPEASRTNVSEEKPYNWRQSQRALRPARHRSHYSAMGQGQLGRPNPPLTRTTLSQLYTTLWVSRSRPAATFWDRTRICSDTASIAMQCLRLLHHSGGP